MSDIFFQLGGGMEDRRRFHYLKKKKKVVALNGGGALPGTQGKQGLIFIWYFYFYFYFSPFQDPSCYLLGLFLWLELIDKTTRKWKLGQDPIFGPTSDFKVAERPDLVYQLLPSRQSVRIVVLFFCCLSAFEKL